MRYQGKIKAWKDEKGFGFITPNGGGSDVFLHISKLDKRGKRPAVGDQVTYELVTDNQKRQQAVNVMFAVSSAKAARATTKKTSSPLFTIIMSVIVLAILGYIVYLSSSHENRVVMPIESNSSVPEVSQPIFTRTEAPQVTYHCTGKKYCSEMTSCAEARFYLKNCSGTEIDGDGDGEPCERQWCN